MVIAEVHEKKPLTTKAHERHEGKTFRVSNSQSRYEDHKLINVNQNYFHWHCWKMSLKSLNIINQLLAIRNAA